MENWRQKHLLLLVSFMLTFGIAFLLSYLHLKQGTSLFPLGINPRIENLTVMTLSVLCVVRTVWEIVRHP